MNVTGDKCDPSATTQSSVDGEAESMSYSDTELDSIFDSDENLCGEDLETNSLWYSDSEVESNSDPDDILSGEDLEVKSLSYSDSEIESTYDPDDTLNGEDLEVNSLTYSDSEIDSVFDLDDILSVQDLAFYELCQTDSEMDSVLAPDNVDFGETPRPFSSPLQDIFCKEVLEYNVQYLLDSDIDSVCDLDDMLSVEDLEFDVLLFHTDSEADYVLAPDEVDFGETLRPFSTSLEGLFCKEDLDCDVQYLLDSEIDSVFDLNDFFSKEDLELDALRFLDSEVDSVLDLEEVDSRETPRPSSPWTSPVISVKVEVVDKTATAVMESDASSENKGEVKHVPQEKVSEVRNANSDSEIESTYDPDDTLNGEDLEVNSLTYSDSEIDSVFDLDDILSVQDLAFYELCQTDSEVDSVLAPDKVDFGETPRPFSSPLQDIFCKEVLEYNVQYLLDSDIDSVCDLDDMLSVEDLEFDVLLFQTDSEADYVLAPDEVDFGETLRPFSPSLEGIFCKEDLDCDVQYLLDSEIDSVFDLNDFFSKEDLELDALRFLDSEVDSVLDLEEVDSRETPRPSSPWTSPVISVKVEVVDKTATAVMESDASSENKGEVKHVPQEKVSEVRNANSDSEIESIYDLDDTLNGEDLEVNSLTYSDSEIDSVFDLDDILSVQDLAFYELCQTDSEMDSVLAPDKVDFGETPRPFSSPLQDIFCKEVLVYNVQYLLDSDIDSVCDLDDMLSVEDLEFDVLLFQTDSEADYVLAPDEVDFGETLRPFSPSLEGIFCKEDLDCDVQYLLDSEIDSVFGLNDFFSKEDLELDALRFLDSEVDSVLDLEEVDSRETPRPSSPWTSPVISVKVEVVDKTATAVMESDASSENKGEVKHVPQEKVSEVRNANSDSEIESIYDPDDTLNGEDLEVNSLTYSDSEIDSVFDLDDILSVQDLAFYELCQTGSEVDSVLAPDKVDFGETPRPFSSPLQDIFCKEVLEYNVQYLLDSDIDSVCDLDDMLSVEDLEFDVLLFQTDSEADYVLAPDEVDFGETPPPFSPSLEGIFCKEDLDCDVQYLLDSEIDSVFDLNDFFSKEDLELDALRFLDSEVDSVLDLEEVDSRETPRPSSPWTSPVISVKVEVVDKTATAVMESDASSENKGEVKHVPQEKVSEVRNAKVEAETEVYVAKRRRKSQRQLVRMSNVGVACRTRSYVERATRSNVREGKAMLYPFCLS